MTTPKRHVENVPHTFLGLTVDVFGLVARVPDPLLAQRVRLAQPDPTGEFLGGLKEDDFVSLAHGVPRGPGRPGKKIAPTRISQRNDVAIGSSRPIPDNFPRPWANCT